MLAVSPPPESQKADVRPISFVLKDGGGFSTPIVLRIRPEDLTRTETSRIAVHQTLGSEIQGWSDNFGEGLPSVTINGHTGWRTAKATGEDGAAAFVALRDMIYVGYHDAKQRAIESGGDPETVKLLFIDMLDEFAWNVAPMQFILRRNKSRPLLLQYSINLQAIDTQIDYQPTQPPFFGGVPSGLLSLQSATSGIGALLGRVKGVVSTALGGLSAVASTVHMFTSLANSVIGAAYSEVAGSQNAFTASANISIGIARDVASVGVNVFRTLAAISGLPSSVKNDLIAVGAAFNEVKCIFISSLKPQATYENFEGLYGASNCSSTTGGRPASPFANLNAFSYLQPLQAQTFGFSGPGLSSVAALTGIDPVLAPLPPQEIGRQLDILNVDLVRMAL
jgi:hypothetical protein